MRELTLEELELVAGGSTDTGDIVVTGGDSGGGGGDFGDWGGGDFGDFGDSGGGGDGGGGGDSTDAPTSPDIIVTADPAHHSATVSIPIPGTNAAGGFTINDQGLSTLNFDIGSSHTTFNITNGLVGETYTQTLSSGQTLTFSGSTNGSDSSLTITYSLRF